MTETAQPPLVPLTTDQERYLREQTEGAVKQGIRYYRNRALIAFGVLAVSVGLSFYLDAQHDTQAENENSEARQTIVDSGRAAVTIGCNRDFKYLKELRGLISDGNETIKQYVQEGTLSPAQGERALAQNQKALDRIPLPDCRLAQDSITQNPEEPVVVPEPLYKKG